MVDFVKVAENNLRVYVQKQQTILAENRNTVQYANGRARQAAVERKQQHQQDSYHLHDKYKDDVKDKMVQLSLMWPNDVLAGDPIPLVAAALTAFFFAPMVVKDVGYGAALVTGYFAGAAACYAELNNSLSKVKPVPTDSSVVSPPTDANPLVLSLPISAAGIVFP